MTATRVWPDGRRKGIVCPEPPCAIHEFEALRTMAVTLLTSRRKRFPDMIRTGAISSDEAARQIAAGEALLADWKFITSLTGEPSPSSTLSSKQALLDASLETIIEIARERDGFTDQLNDQAHCIIALRWHLEPGRITVELARLQKHWRDLGHEQGAASSLARHVEWPRAMRRTSTPQQNGATL